jgi:hypothetical protein
VASEFTNGKQCAIDIDRQHGLHCSAKSIAQTVSDGYASASHAEVKSREVSQFVPRHALQRCAPCGPVTPAEYRHEQQRNESPCPHFHETNPFEVVGVLLREW